MSRSDRTAAGPAGALLHVTKDSEVLAVMTYMTVV